MRLTSSSESEELSDRRVAESASRARRTSLSADGAASLTLSASSLSARRASSASGVAVVQLRYGDEEAGVGTACGLSIGVGVARRGCHFEQTEFREYGLGLTSVFAAGRGGLCRAGREGEEAEKDQWKNSESGHVEY